MANAKNMEIPIPREPADRWTVQDSADLYDVSSWGKGYFSIAENGNLLVHPTKDPFRSIDLKQVMDTLLLRGIPAPVLVRFSGILKHRLEEIAHAFQNAIQENGYQGEYRCVFPIKVNQQKQVVDEVLRFGRPFHFGLEAGSKPELLAVLAITDNETPIICNGFKDQEFIDMVLYAKKIGRNIIPVVERFKELEMIIATSARLKVKPAIGLRVKLASRGAGRWKSSGGYRSKFGCTVDEALRTVSLLKEHGMEDSFQLIHFHLGSQITNIRRIKTGVTEAARVYAELVKAGAGLRYLDVGGGLGVDYDGSQTDFESSVNYTLEEYASDVIYHVRNVCDEAKVAHPTIFSESGRAIAAHHSVLVFNVLGISSLGASEVSPEVTEEDEQPLHDLNDTFRGLSSKNLLESYHDANEALDQALNLFSLGYLTLEQRCRAEHLFFSICRRIHRMAGELTYFPEELEVLESILADTYYCNFSLFQSIPDSWAINQLFPIMPIHRLGEKPLRQAVLGDVSCDSDGKIDQFIDRRDVKRTIRLHSLNDDYYHMGIFLVGAYQEILGDLHNLFGDTNAVHVNLDANGEVVVEAVIKGDTVEEVLHYVQFNAESLINRFRKDAEAAMREGKICMEELGRLVKFYEEGLRGYTYLEDEE